jgi:ketosteroid isomerase-like protein
MRALTLMVATGLLAACNDQSTAQDDPEVQLRAASAQYDQALIEGDAAALNRHYTDDFQRIGNDGAMHDKKSQVQFMTQEVDLVNGQGDDVKITMLGPDGALVTGRFAGRYRYKGKEGDFTERYTSVWVRKAGQWRVRHEHASLVPMPQ